MRVKSYKPTKHSFSFGMPHAQTYHAPMFEDMYKGCRGRNFELEIDDHTGEVSILAARMFYVYDDDNLIDLNAQRSEIIKSLTENNLDFAIVSFFVIPHTEKRLICYCREENPLGTRVETSTRVDRNWKVARKIQRYMSRIESDPQKKVLSVIRNNQILSLANHKKEAKVANDLSKELADTLVKMGNYLTNQKII